MAHRALVAYRDGDGYHLHYAHDGEGVADRITAATPFGGRSEQASTQSPSDPIADRFDIDPSGGYTSPTRVDPHPLARTVEPASVLRAIDATIETLVVVAPDDTTRTYAVCPLGIDGGGPLVVVGPTDDAASVRGTVRDRKERLGAAVGAGRLDAETARRVLRRALARHGAVHSLDDASFLRTG